MGFVDIIRLLHNSDEIDPQYAQISENCVKYAFRVFNYKFGNGTQNRLIASVYAKALSTILEPQGIGVFCLPDDSNDEMTLHYNIKSSKERDEIIRFLEETLELADSPRFTTEDGVCYCYD
jgi:hypothetical protein